MSRSMSGSIGLGLLAWVVLVPLSAGQICGDCNLDESLSILDSLQAARFTIGSTTLIEGQLVLCDTNDDSIVDILDALRVAQMTAGMTIDVRCDLPIDGEDQVTSPLLFPADSLTAGDFDQDGFEDVAVLEGATGTVRFYRSNGTGGLVAAGTLFMGPNCLLPTSPAPECDGIIDLGMVRRNPPELLVAVNAAVPGSFLFVVQAFPLSTLEPVALRFFDADGDMFGVDEYAIVGDAAAGEVMVRKQSGITIATYDLEFPVDVGGLQIDVAIGHLNGDATPDIVALLDSGQVIVAFSNGPDSWTSPVPVGSVSVPAAGLATMRLIETRDLTGDGAAEIVAANGAAVRVFENSGAGSFLAGVDFLAPGAVVSLELADLDRDSPPTAPDADIDLVAAFQNFNFGGLVAFLDARASGPAATPALLGRSEILLQRTAGSTAGCVLPDLDGDGHIDAVLLGENNAELVAKRQNVIETFLTADPADVAVADLDGDLIADVVLTSTSGAGSLTVLIGDGAGGFVSATNMITPPGLGVPSRVRVIDLDGDGDIDIVAIGSGLGIGVFINDGAGVFPPPAIFLSMTGLASSIAIGDVAGSPLPDLIVGCAACGVVEVFENQAAGTFVRLSLQVGPVLPPENASSVEICDSDGDGDIDDIALIPQSAPAELRIYANNRAPGGDPLFALASTTTFAPGTNFIDLVSVDFSGDGLFDHALLDQNGEAVQILFAASPTLLTLQPQVDLRPQGTPVGLVNPRRIAAGPYIRAVSGTKDLAVSTASAGVLTIVGDPTGRFTFLGRRVPTGVPSGLAIADMDGGGQGDVVTGNVGRNSVRVFLGE